MTYERLDGLLRQLRLEAWIALLTTTLVLALLGASLYLVKPSWLRFRELATGSGAQALAELDERSQANASAIATLDGEISRLRGELFGGSAELPPEQMESFIIDRLEALSVQRGVRLVGVTPGDVGEVLMFQELPYDVEVHGGYFALHDWLFAVERELRPLVVKRFELKGRSREAEVALKVRLVSYRAQEESA